VIIFGSLGGIVHLPKWTSSILFASAVDHIAPAE